MSKKKAKTGTAKKPRKSGPPLSLTEKTLNEACDIVRAGNFRKIAASRLGVPLATWASWLRRGRSELEDFTKGKCKSLGLKGRLIVELDRAEAEAHQDMLTDVVKNGSPELKLKFLRLRYGKLYSANPNAHLDDETGEEIKRTAADILAEKLAAFIEGE